MEYGGGGGIRTHGPLSRPSVFKTGALNRTLPPLLELVVMVGIEPTTDRV